MRPFLEDHARHLWYKKARGKCEQVQNAPSSHTHHLLCSTIHSLLPGAIPMAAQSDKPIVLYTLGTPNGVVVSIFLEELKVCMLNLPM